MLLNEYINSFARLIFWLIYWGNKLAILSIRDIKELFAKSRNILKRKIKTIYTKEKFTSKAKISECE